MFTHSDSTNFRTAALSTVMAIALFGLIRIGAALSHASHGASMPAGSLALFGIAHLMSLAAAGLGFTFS
ncbi:hypothetical protein [Bradyrhizobium sp. ARR65]|uniref:hypothetical protein n=1 Tax=Bradyrhizobium sp. ARR65 TaxID=1040989 RepID=UPI000466115B|nr:hypothetical protein [Bradyrhizobium sp. ARR65]